MYIFVHSLSFHIILGNWKASMCKSIVQLWRKRFWV